MPLLNPTLLLKITAPLGAVLFRMSFFYAVSVAAIIAILIALLNWQAILHDATTFNSNLHGDRLWITFALLVGIKLLHELGHGMACVTFGGECTESGVILLFGTPSLYCDVTDSWKLPDRWKRVVIAAGGIYIELILATIACFFWALSDSIVLRGIAIQIMIVCSLMTLLLNANPLLRYDGYYILSDLLGIPNLSDECRRAWNNKWTSFFIESNPVNDRITAEPPGSIPWMIAYHIVSFWYRFFLLVAIVTLAHSWLQSNGLRSLARAMILGSIVLVVLVFFIKLRLAILPIFQSNRIHWTGLAIFSTLLFLAVLLLAFLPLPSSVVTRGYLEPSNFSKLFARSSAVLVNAASNGQRLSSGSQVFELESINLELDILKTEGEFRIAEARVAQLENRLTNDPETAQQVSETKQKIIGLQSRVSELKTERDKLKVYASKHGVFLDPLTAPRELVLDEKSDLPRIDLQNKVIGRYHVERGELLGYVGDNDHLVVNALLAEYDLQKIPIGSKAKIRVDQHPGRTFDGTVVSISSESVTHTPEPLAGDSLFQSQKTPSLAVMPEETAFMVAIALNQTECKAMPFGLATVKINTAPKTIVSQFYDQLISRFSLAR
jgi:putative peptide zinc metalloprotease protein